METKDRFKRKINSKGKVTWYFQAFRTTKRGFRTKREAQLAYLEMEKEYRFKKQIVTKNEKFSVVAKLWFEYYKSLGEQKQSTYEKRSEILKTLCRWLGDKELVELESEFLEGFFYMLKEKGIDGKSKGYSKNSLQGLKQTLNMIFKFCVKKSFLTSNPLTGVKLPKYQKSVEELKKSLNCLDQDYLTIDELRTFLNYSIIHEDLPLSTLFHVLFYTGCRVSEALALQKSDILTETNEILFYKQTVVSGKQADFRIESTKTNSSARRVAVTPLVMNKLKVLVESLDKMRKDLEFKNDDNYLFIYLEQSKRGIPFRREYVNDHIKKCVSRSGINKPFHTHLARHTMTSLVAEHCSWDVLKARLGHTDKSTSEIYRHLTANERLKPLTAFIELEE
ncbi:integrase [Enterococcus florum]|uniref:Integrase n=1 Tax=Enterococcus florum TaxID=2480627 RepID=A0A4P5P9J0_9ENTE|nr:tyrosine-type recombinase/integrase [Enterococcus florum]GCF92142.1 integrase [Enterococcus florum]